MTMSNQLLLRDIHTPAAPPWWPPAPGWWAVAGVLLATAALAWWWLRRSRSRRDAIACLFDDTVANAATATARIAAMSEMLRRASRRRDAQADRLEGEAWLRFLDGETNPPAFSQGPGRLLLDGGFRRKIADADIAALQPIARARFLDWMSARR